MQSATFSVDASIYLDQTRFLREQDFLLKKSWILACHESEVSSAGAYYVFEHLGQSVIILRDESGQIHALQNTCRHRGSYLLKSSGHCRTITCPYHGWKYNQDGSGIPNGLDLRPDAAGLQKVHSSVSSGFVWLHFGKNPPDFSEHLAETGRYFEAFHSADMVVYKKRHFLLDCNWKNYLENILDSYHIATVHNSLLQKIARVSELDITREHKNLVLKIPIADYRWRIALEKHLARAPSAGDLTRSYHKLHIFPNTVINFTALNATVYNIWPRAVGQTLVDYTFLRAKSYNPLVLARNALLFRYSMLINREDNAILPDYYRNLMRNPKQQHRFVSSEASLIELHKGLAKYLK